MIRPGQLRQVVPFTRALLKGKLSKQSYDRSTATMMLVLPPLIYPPLHYMNSSSPEKNRLLTMDLMNAWVGLACFYATRKPAGMLLQRMGVASEPLRFLLSSAVGVVARTTFNGIASVKISDRLAERYQMMPASARPPVRIVRPTAVQQTSGTTQQVALQAVPVSVSPGTAAPTAFAAASNISAMPNLPTNAANITNPFAGLNNAPVRATCRL